MPDLDGPTPEPGLTDLVRLAKGAVGVMLVQGFGALLAYTVQIQFSRWLGAEAFGAFNVAITLGTGLGIVAALGFPVAVLRFIPEYQAVGAGDALQALLRFTNSRTALWGGSLGLLLTAVLLGLHLPWDYAVLTGALIPLFGLAELNGESVRAVGSVVRAYAPRFLLRPAVFLVAGFLVFQRNPDSGNAALVALIGVGAVAIAQWISRRRFLRPSLIHRGKASATDSRRWLKTSLPLMLMTGTAFLTNQLDILVVGASLGFTDAGHYSAAQRTATIVGFLLFASNAVVAPVLARHFANNDIPRLRSVVATVTRWTSVGAVLLGGGIAVFGTQILRLFGPGFERGMIALLILIAGKVASAFVGPVGYLLGLTGHEKEAARVQVAAGGGALVLLPLLASRFGLLGVAIGAAGTLACVNFGLAFLVWKHYRIAPFGILAANRY